MRDCHGQCGQDSPGLCIMKSDPSLAGKNLIQDFDRNQVENRSSRSSRTAGSNSFYEEIECRGCSPRYDAGVTGIRRIVCRRFWAKGVGFSSVIPVTCFFPFTDDSGRGMDCVHKRKRSRYPFPCCIQSDFCLAGWMRLSSRTYFF